MPSVLFFDDDPALLRANRIYFERRRFQVYTAETLLQAEHLLMRHRVDCIVLDILMPGTDGWDVCQRLKSQGFTLEEIQRVYSTGGERELAGLYGHKIEEMERKIAYDQHVLARMRQTARALETAQRHLMRPVRLSLGRVYLLEYPSLSSDPAFL